MRRMKNRPFIGLLAVVLCCGACFAESDSQETASGREPAAVMSHEGAAWLERPARDAEERPDLVFEAMALEPGDVVADIGVGTGYHARKMAPLVAPGGKVLGVDIQPEMLAMLEERAKAEGIENIEPILGDVDDPKLPAGEVDWVLLVDAYHEFAEPRPMLERIKEALAPDGRVALVEFRLEGDTAKHIKEDHRMSVEQVMTEWEPAGFVLERRIDDLPSQHLFIFRAGDKPEEE